MGFLNSTFDELVITSVKRFMIQVPGFVFTKSFKKVVLEEVWILEAIIVSLSLFLGFHDVWSKHIWPSVF
jgi:hypothetical protein